MTGLVHSLQSFGATDGPGVRFIVFFSGCNLRCGCCHNPDTWHTDKATEYTADELIERLIRFHSYFGLKGGITASGGEPLLQAEFVCELFRKAHENGINTCLDTSGSIMNDKVRALLDETDYVLLDIKYTDEESYRKYVGCSMRTPLEFLSYLNSKGIDTTLRQVIIPTLNDNEENIKRLKNLARMHWCVTQVDLLPFRKMCQTKYDELGIEFPFAHLPTPPLHRMNELEALLRSDE